MTVLSTIINPFRLWGTSNVLRYMILKIEICIWLKHSVTRDTTQCHVHSKRECGLRQFSWHFNWILMKLLLLPQEMQSLNIPSPTFRQQNCKSKKRNSVIMTDWLLICAYSVAPTHVCISPASGRLRRVTGSHSSGDWGQELLPLLLYQTCCADDLVARCPQIRPVNLLCQVFCHHLQVRLR